MKKNLASLLSSPTWSGVALLIVVLLAGCGDTVENTMINQTGMEVVASIDDLPKCSSDNEGDQAYVKGESFSRICDGADWVALTGSASEFSCKTEELKDKSGLVIVCNGDSIGVVMNGEKGEAGEDGKDGKDAVVSNDTLKNDSESVEFLLDSIVGYVQKGPFFAGAAVSLEELDSVQAFSQTGMSYQDVVRDNTGYYKIRNVTLASPYLALVATGFYYNEVTNSKSSAAITLKGLIDVRNHTSANINLATHLEFYRARYLVTQKKLTLEQAKTRAQKEIFQQIGIDATDFPNSEDLNILGPNNEDKALLTLSVMLLGAHDSVDYSALLTAIAMDLEEDGAWNDSTTRIMVADWCAFADSADLFTAIHNNMASIGYSGAMPNLEKNMHDFWTKEYGLGSCVHGNVGTVRAATSGKTAGTKTRYICKENGIDDFSWEIATDFEKDTYGWEKGSVGEVRSGQVTGKKYKYARNRWIEESEWTCYENSKRKEVTLDGTLILTCEGDEWVSSAYPYLCEIGSSAEIGGKYYGCVGSCENGDCSIQWIEIPERIFLNTADSACTKDGKIISGSKDTSSYFICKANLWRVAEPIEFDGNKICVYENIGQISGYRGEFYTCTAEGWKKVVEGAVGYMDDADGRRYKTVVLMGQQWMAENLNYKMDGSYCYNDDEDFCRNYGRLYTWDAAMEACPDGWHLPLSDISVATMQKILSKTDFGIRTVGYRDVDGSYKSIVDRVFFWGAKDSNDNANRLICSEQNGCSLDWADKKMAFSVRCLQDNE